MPSMLCRVVLQVAKEDMSTPFLSHIHEHGNSRQALTVHPPSSLPVNVLLWSPHVSWTQLTCFPSSHWHALKLQSFVISIGVQPLTDWMHTDWRQFTTKMLSELHMQRAFCDTMTGSSLKYICWFLLHHLEQRVYSQWFASPQCWFVCTHCMPSTNKNTKRSTLFSFHCLTPLHCMFNQYFF